MGGRQGALEDLVSEMNQYFWKNKRVLVSGHTGFKGSWLALWLLRKGAKVAGLSLEPPSNPSLFELSGLREKTQTTIGDIRDYATVKKVFDKFQPEIVFHMAAQALVRPSYQNPVETYATNIMGTVHMFEATRQSQSVRAFVNITSDKCYENREWAWGYRENEPMGGFDPYSSSKGCAELVTAAYRRSFFKGAASGVKGSRLIGFASARAGNVVGGGDWAEDRLIPDCIRALCKGDSIGIRNPHSIRPWQHVLEPVGGYLLLAEKLWDNPEEFSAGWNFGPETVDAQPVQWLVDRIVKLWGGDASWELLEEAHKPHEAHYLKLDCSLAREKLGWRPRMDLDRTLEWTVKWYRAHADQGKSVIAKLCASQLAEYESLPS